MLGWGIVLTGLMFLITARFKALVRGSILVVIGIVIAVENYNTALTTLIYIQLIFWLTALYGTTRGTE